MPRTSSLAYMEQKKLEPLHFWNFDAPKAGEPLNYGKLRRS